jgi:hypothetical protein
MQETSPSGNPASADVLGELIAREPLFHRPEFGTAREDYARMVVDDYWETGASGRRYSLESVLDVLEQRQRAPGEDRWETSDFRCRALGGNCHLLTYTLRQDRRITRRMTLWRRDLDGWRAVYHQGTVVQEESAA